MENIHAIVRAAEQNYIKGTSKQGKYVDYSMYEIVERITAYLNSKFVDGDEDSLGRPKPFFNIVSAACNIWYRATDLDRKDIKILPDRNSTVGLAFMASVHLQRWMDKARFGVFLNLWGRMLAKYGSAVVKFIEKDGELVATVIPWNRFIADPIDFNAIPHIEKFFRTPAQLRKIKNYDQDVVNSLIGARNSRTIMEGQQVDSQNNFIEIYEVHGELPTYMLDKDPVAPDEKDIKYRQQMHVVSFLANSDGGFNDYTLYKGKEAKDPYMITHLIEEDDRTLSIGAVEYLFDAQWMQNHSMKQWKDQMDLSSKLIFQTADGNYVGRNVLNAIEVGDIMIHADNKPLTLINNQGHDVGSIQAFGSTWKALGQELSNTPDLTRGITQAQPVTYGLGQIMNANTNSLFEIMTENKGMYVEEMLRTYVIPHIKSKLNTAEEIMTTLDEQGISQIDAMFIPKEAIRRHNRKTINKVLGLMEDDMGNTPSPFMRQPAEQEIQQELSSQGNMRSFKPSEVSTATWREVMKDVNWDNLKVEVTNENNDKNANLLTLTTLFQTIASMQGRPMTPDEKMVFGKILKETSVVSPMELSTSSNAPMPPQPTASPPLGQNVVQ